MAKQDGCPAIHTKKSDSTRKYYFENRGQPGADLNFFADSGGQVKTFDLKDSSVVELTEEMAYYIKSKGVEKPIVNEDDYGKHKSSDRTYIERKFDLHEV